MNYAPSPSRYKEMIYNRCGKSGLLFPAISLGLWHNFGHVDVFEKSRSVLLKAFDLGITHFDLANNYGPPPGSAEENFGKVINNELKPYRDEIIISTKAGYTMWDGPYGDWGSRKYLIASLDQSLQRMNLPYVDIFYSHRYDPNTPLEETMGALSSIVKQGKALYAAISNYPADKTREAIAILKANGTPCLIHQANYSLLNRWVEDELLDVIEENGLGCISFSSLAQGQLTNKYLNGIPADSRAAKPSSPFLNPENLTEEKLSKIRKLNSLAESRNQSLAQMSLSWILKDKRMTSLILGASKIEQLEDSIKSIHNTTFTDNELEQINKILS